MFRIPLLFFVVAAQLLVAVALAQPPGVLPGEDSPLLVIAPQPTPHPEGTPPPGILPGEDAPTVMPTSSMQTANDSLDWGVSRIGAGADIWTKTKGKGIRVAVLDTGGDLAHPDLRDGIAASKDFTGSRSGPSDVNGHGSHCCGVIGARLDGQGLAGVAPECSILVGKVLGDNGSGADAWIAAGIDWSIAQGADVISMSLGGSYSKVTHDAVKRAVAAGVIVVAAAGNAGPGENTFGYPGGLPESICVAATDRNDAVARFSSRGAPVYIAAPGVEILSCFPGARYAKMSGTSMATPHVAGCAALWVSLNQAIPKTDRPAKFRETLGKATKDIAPPGRDTATGYGLVILSKLLEGSQVEPPVTPPAAPLTFTENDLTEDARKRLNAIFPGGKFRLDLPVPAVGPGVLPQPKE